MLFVVVKKYSTESEPFNAWVFRIEDQGKIFMQIFRISDDNYMALDAVNWTQSAVKGDVYKFDEGEVEIISIE